MQRRTLASSFELDGVGVHSGEACAARVGPGEGFVFRVGGVEVPAHVDCVVDTTMSTTLGRGSARVGMVEHLLSALWGLGVRGARVDVEGPELPILDGSAKPWAEAILAASEPSGVEPRGARVTVELSDRGGLAALGPRRVTFDFDRDDYLAEVAWARTFVHAADVDRLLAAGMGAGATEENTLIVPRPGEPLPATRGPSEPSRHKLLDAIGDLALAGRPHEGTITLVDSGHAAHVALARGVGR